MTDIYCPERAGVIVADPNWSYANWSDKAHGAARSHYECASVEELSRIPVASLARDDCVLALWCTWPKMLDGVALMRAWGFDYVTGFPWVKVVEQASRIACPDCGLNAAYLVGRKPRRGIGFWTMSASEFMIFGRRGAPKMRDRKDTPIGLVVGDGDADDRVFWAPVRGHSVKPEGIQDWLERKFDGPYLEMFARRQRQNWTTYGHGVGTHLSAKGVEPWPVS